MKTDLYGALAVYAALGETLTWIWIASALLLTLTGAWCLIHIARRIYASFAHAIRVCHEVAADQTTDHTPELDAGYARLDAAIDQHRKEKL